VLEWANFSKIQIFFKKLLLDLKRSKEETRDELLNLGHYMPHAGFHPALS
jgi:hypothetical protein